MVDSHSLLRAAGNARLEFKVQNTELLLIGYILSSSSSASIPKISATVLAAISYLIKINDQFFLANSATISK